MGRFVFSTGTFGNDPQKMKPNGEDYLTRRLQEAVITFLLILTNAQRQATKEAVK